MSYVSSSAPLPQNSTMAPPAAEAAASQRRLWQDFEASRRGRERVYANLPTAADLYALSPGLAVDAQRILTQSETARQSVLNGLGLPASLLPVAIVVSAPTVVSLNAGEAVDGTMAPENVPLSTMPLAVGESALGLWQPANSQTTAAAGTNPEFSSYRTGTSIVMRQNVGERGSQNMTTSPASNFGGNSHNAEVVTGNCRNSSSTFGSGGGIAPAWGDAGGVPSRSPGSRAAAPLAVAAVAMGAVFLIGLFGKRGAF